jgi:hypothetical protein
VQVVTVEITARSRGQGRLWTLFVSSNAAAFIRAASSSNNAVLSRAELARQLPVFGSILFKELLLRYPLRQERIFRPDCQPELFLDLVQKFLRAGYQ